MAQFTVYNLRIISKFSHRTSIEGLDADADFDADLEDDADADTEEITFSVVNPL